MKRIIILLSVVLSFNYALLNAQNCEIVVIPYIQDKIAPLPEETRSYLETKLSQIVTKDGIAGAGFGQFYLISKFALLNKDILPGPPVMISQKISVTLSLFDYFGEKVIASTTLELQATGANENKAYINGIRNLNPDNAKVQEFLKSGKEKMLSYYDNNYNTIIKKAQNLAAMKQYEEALFYLSAVPECSKGYDATTAVAKSVYKEYIDYHCLRTLQQARSAWAASPNAAGAAEAGEYLAMIEPDAKCYSDALALYNEIKNSVKEDWKFEFKNYDERALERERINAIREVGTAFGKGQQPSTTVIGRM